MGKYAIEFYESNASALATGPDTGRNAPDDGTGRWRGQSRETLKQAEALFAAWTDNPRVGAYKRIRIRDTTASKIVRDTIEFPVTVVV